MRNVLIFVYGVASYAVSMAVIVYTILFIGNLWVTPSLDAAPAAPLWFALPVDLALLGLFFFQHSAMARPKFKAWLTRFMPAEAERSTYLLFTSAAMIALFAFWQPLGGVVWQVETGAAAYALWAGYGLGWVLIFASTFQINHFDLFGLRQVWLCLRGRPYTRVLFQQPLLYRHVRHPLYAGWLLAFWCAPVMTAAHLVFAVTQTAYILYAIRLEERDLVAEHGETYEAYRRRVPMLFPRLRAKPLESAVQTAD